MKKYINFLLEKKKDKHPEVIKFEKQHQQNKDIFEKKWKDKDKSAEKTKKEFLIKNGDWIKENIKVKSWWNIFYIFISSGRVGRSDLITLQEKLSNNRDLVKNYLSKKVYEYTSYEVLMDDLIRLDDIKIFNNFRGKLPKHLKKQIKVKDLTDKEKTIILDYSELDKTEREKIFKPAIKFGNITKYLKHVSDVLLIKNSDYKNILDNVNDISTSLVYDEDGIFIFRTFDHEFIVNYGSNKWCIVYDMETYYDDYINPLSNYTFYLVLNTNLSNNDKDSKFGFTMDEYGNFMNGGQQNNYNETVELDEVSDIIDVTLEDFIEPYEYDDETLEVYKVVRKYKKNPEMIDDDIWDKYKEYFLFSIDVFSHAIVNNNKDRYVWFIENGFDVNKLANDERRSIFLFGYDNIDLIKYLLDNDFRLSSDDFYNFIYDDDNKLSDKNFLIDKFIKDIGVESNKWTSFYRKNKKINILEIYLENKIISYCRDHTNDINPEVFNKITYLIDKGSNNTSKESIALLTRVALTISNFGNKITSIAVMSNLFKFLSILIDKGIEKNITECFYVFAQNNNCFFYSNKLLTDYNININKRIGNQTLINRLLEFESSDSSVILKLIENGVVVDTNDLYTCLENKSTQITKFFEAILTSKNFINKLNNVNDFRPILFHTIVSNINNEYKLVIVKLLLENGADLNFIPTSMNDEKLTVKQLILPLKNIDDSIKDLLNSY